MSATRMYTHQSCWLRLKWVELVLVNHKHDNVFLVEAHHIQRTSSSSSILVIELSIAQ